MNKSQKVILLLMALIVLVMLLYPPFYVDGGSEGKGSWGYDWIFAENGRPMVDTRLLITQWIGVLIIGGILYAVLTN